MSDYVIMTDSSCDLPAALADQMELTVLPLYVDVDGQKYTNYLDEREISFSEIYAKLRTKCPAKTSAASQHKFKIFFALFLIKICTQGVSGSVFSKNSRLIQEGINGICSLLHLSISNSFYIFLDFLNLRDKNRHGNQ